MDATTFPPAPINEPNLTYAPGTPEREALVVEIDRLKRRELDLKAHIGGRRRSGGGREIKVVQPHDHQHVLGVMKNSDGADAKAAINAAAKAAPDWRALPFDERCAILLKAADLLAGPWRQRLNAATMLGQSKTAFQAEIDSACELIDFWRFNVHYAKQILADQPIANSPGIWNHTDHRPSRASSTRSRRSTSPRSPATCPPRRPSWATPSSGSPRRPSSSPPRIPMQLLEGGDAARRDQHAPGDGVGRLRGGAGPPRPRRHPLHRLHRGFRACGDRRREPRGYRSYPRIVGETGGKDFIVAHPSADPTCCGRAGPRRLRVPGQKCSAAPCLRRGSVWRKMKDFLAEVESLTMGDVTDRPTSWAR